MNAGVLENTRTARKGFLSGFKPTISTRAIVTHVLILVVGLVLGVLFFQMFFGYGTINSIELVIAGSDGNAQSLGTFQVYKVIPYYSLDGNHLRIAAGADPLQ